MFCTTNLPNHVCKIIYGELEITFDSDVYILNIARGSQFKKKNKFLNRTVLIKRYRNVEMTSIIKKETNK